MDMNTGEQAGQYLSFRLDEEVFALNISRVREVLDYTRVTRVPRMPDFMRGVINLRGVVVPVVDLRQKFGMSQTEQSVNTRIIIGEVDIAGEKAVLGALADAVHEVIDLEPASIEPAPRIGAQLDTRFIQGMGKRDEEFVMILDIDRIFTGEELSLVSGSAREGEQTA